jgi:hypothetical protein
VKAAVRRKKKEETLIKVFRMQKNMNEYIPKVPNLQKIKDMGFFPAIDQIK